MTLKRTVEPAFEPITLDQAKDHCRVDLDFIDDDALISELIKTARDWVEQYTQMPLITQTWKLYADAFSDVLELKPNAKSITQIRYIDNAGAWQIIPSTDYILDEINYKPVVYLAYDKQWPTPRNVKNSVEVEFIAGFATADEVPSSIKAAMLLLIGHWYMNRESVTVGVSVTETPQGVELLLNPYRVIYV